MRLPEPKQLPSGKWYLQIMVEGKRYNRTFDTAEEALYWAAGLKTKAIEDQRAPATLTVGEAVERYISTKGAVLSPSTIRGYETIRKQMGSVSTVALNRLTQEAVQRWVNEMAREKTAKTVQNAHGLLSAVLKEYRPAMALRTTLPRKRKREIQIPTQAHIQAIVAASAGTRYELPIALGVWLGLRQSEILGLKWEDIEGETLQVRRAIVVGAAGAVEKAPKTYSGTRRVHIPAEVRALLAQTQREGPYIVNLSGKAIYSGFVRICAKAGVPHYRFHDLRHFNASVMLAAGIPDKYSMKRMGHATNHMLKTTYQHTIKEREAAYDASIEAQIAQILHPGKPGKGGGFK